MDNSLLKPLSKINQIPNQTNFMKYLLLISTLALSQLVIAQDETINPAEKQSTEDKGKFTYSGYFDTYYFANLNAPASRSNLGSSGISRGFDRYPGQFQLGMFLNRMSYAYKNTEVVAEIGFGPNVEYGSYGSDFRYKWGSVIANNTYTALMIKQAYINYKPSEKLTFTMGQFGTHIGYELIDAPLNFHYSINNTFNAGIPFYHLGLKANYAFSEKVSLMGGVVNGTDNINDNNRGKSFIGQLTVSPAKGLTVYLNTIQGNEANSRSLGNNAGGDTTSYFGVLDLVATYQATDRLLLAIWAMQGSVSGEFQGGTYFAETKNWSGANLYVSYKFTDIFSLGTRIEYFDNMSGARALLTNGKGTDVNTYTLTGNFSLADGKLTLKPEFRLDSFRKMKGPLGDAEPQQFQDSNGSFTKNTQSTLGMAVIYKF
jgi:Putative beta-barrel porin-2, OmpL-like. bbp2